MKHLSFKDFVEKYGLKDESTSNVKINEILKLKNTTECGIYMRDDHFTTPLGLVNLHPTKGTQWVMFTQSASVKNEFYFASCGCPPPTDILNHINTGIYSEYQIQKTTVIAQRVVYMFHILHKL